MLLIMSVEATTPADTAETDQDTVVLAVTEAALESVLAIRAEEPDPAALALRV